LPAYRQVEDVFVMTASLPPSPRSRLPIGARMAILARADLRALSE